MFNWLAHNAGGRGPMERGETSAKPREQVFLTSSVWKLKMYADTTSRPGTLVWETTPRNGNKK